MFCPTSARAAFRRAARISRPIYRGGTRSIRRSAGGWWRRGRKMPTSVGTTADLLVQPSCGLLLKIAASLAGEGGERQDVVAGPVEMGRGLEGRLAARASRDELAGKPRDVPAARQASPSRTGASPLPRAPGRSLVSPIPRAPPGFELSLEQIALNRERVLINPDRLPEHQKGGEHHEATC
jgi:hypothetical protein